MLTEEQIREICLNIANSGVKFDQGIPRNCFDPSRFVGAYQALKYTYLDHMQTKQQEIEKLNEQVKKLEELLKY